MEAVPLQKYKVSKISWFNSLAAIIVNGNLQHYKRIRPNFDPQTIGLMAYIGIFASLMDKIISIYTLFKFLVNPFCALNNFLWSYSPFLIRHGSAMEAKLKQPPIKAKYIPLLSVQRLEKRIVTKFCWLLFLLAAPYKAYTEYLVSILGFKFSPKFTTSFNRFTPFVFSLIHI